MSNIRPYHVDDGKFLGDMLLTEGLKPDEMGFATGNTYVYDDNGIVKGFYTYRIDHDVFPHITHFCVGRKYRGIGRIAYRLIKDLTKRIGFGKIIIHAKNKEIAKLVEHYFDTKPYGEDRECKFYLAKV